MLIRSEFKLDPDVTEYVCGRLIFISITPEKKKHDETLKSLIKFYALFQTSGQPKYLKWFKNIFIEDGQVGTQFVHRRATLEKDI